MYEGGKMNKLYKMLPVSLLSTVILCGCVSGYSNNEYQGSTAPHVFDMFGKGKRIIFSWDGNDVQAIRAVDTLDISQAASLKRSSSDSMSYACLHVTRGRAGLCDGVSFDLFEERQFSGVADSIVGTALLPLTLSLDILEPHKKGGNTANSFTNVGVSREAISYFSRLLNEAVYKDYVSAKSQQSIEQFESFMEKYNVEYDDEKFSSVLDEIKRGSIVRYRNMGTVDGYLSAFGLSLSSYDSDNAKNLAVTQGEKEKVAEYLRDVEEGEIIRLGEEVLTYEVESNHSEGIGQSSAGLVSRTQATARDVNTRVRVTMNVRPLNNDYTVRLRIIQHAEHQCISSMEKTSYPIQECDILNDDRDIGEVELTLSKSNNWTGVQEINSKVAYFTVIESPVAKHEAVLSKLAVEPELVSIEAVR
ncbi:hypothetical protein HALTITAN_2084 [Vreelandella titanicae BH1]|uniref:Lipoprotein n=2 Tax=Vreelandella titanicae TaxID=664683 RepID=L9U8G2_9GAMM|nr:hypothetical protein HALTITAN_2084 [Halomonas titanicae BH1]